MNVVLKMSLTSPLARSLTIASRVVWENEAGDGRTSERKRRWQAWQPPQPLSQRCLFSRQDRNFSRTAATGKKVLCVR